MNRYQLHITSNAGELVLQTDAVVRLLSKKNGDAALLYLAILKGGQELSQEGLMQQFGWTSSKLRDVEQVLLELKLISIGTSGSDTVCETPASTGSFPDLVAVVEQKLGKMLSPSDLTKLLGLRKGITLPDDVIVLLVDFCIEISQSRSGKRRKPGMQQIEQEGLVWAERGITDCRRAIAYVEMEKRKAKNLPRLKKLLGLQDRNLSATEERLLISWADMGFDDESLQFAYDKTVRKCQELNWSYMDKILTSWDAKGLHTIAEVRNEVQPDKKATYTQNHEQIKESEGRAIRDDFSRMEKYLKELREERAASDKKTHS